MLTVCVLVFAFALPQAQRGTQPEPRIAQPSSTAETQRAEESDRQQRAADSQAIQAILKTVTEIQQKQAADLQANANADAQQIEINRNISVYTGRLVWVGVGQMLVAAGTIYVIFLQLKAVRLTERAWVDIDVVRAQRMITANGKQTDIARPHEFVVHAKNHGKTVARLSGFKMVADTVAGNVDEPTELSQITTEHAESLLGSDKDASLCELNLEKEFGKEWPNLLNGTKTGFIRLAVEYRDIVHGRKLRETFAIYRCFVIEGTQVLPGRKFKYNRHK